LPIISLFFFPDFKRIFKSGIFFIELAPILAGKQIGASSPKSGQLQPMQNAEKTTMVKILCIAMISQA
jgi:hypothetical protein